MPGRGRKPGEKINLLLVGCNGARSTGSDARLAALSRHIRAVFGPDNVGITVTTLDRAALEGYYDEDMTLRPFSSIFLWDLYRACPESHAAILCEGSALKSTSSPGRRLSGKAVRHGRFSEGSHKKAPGREHGKRRSAASPDGLTGCR